MHRFKELKIWQRAMELTVEIYKLTDTLPQEERFGLISQMRRSAVSIPSNIAEGAGRRTDKEFRNFLNISNGSASELETQLIICNRLGFLDADKLEFLSDEINQIQSMNFALTKTLSS